MSLVSGATKEQLVLTPETGGRLHLRTGDTPLQQVPWVTVCPQGSRDVTCGTKGRRLEKPSGAQPWTREDGLFLRSSVETSSLGQLVFRGPGVSFKM